MAAMPLAQVTIAGAPHESGTQIGLGDNGRAGCARKASRPWAAPTVPDAACGAYTSP